MIKFCRKDEELTGNFEWVSYSPMVHDSPMRPGTNNEKQNKEFQIEKSKTTKKPNPIDR